MNIADLSIDDLLHNTEDRELDTSNPIDKWLTAQGIYPGSTRVMASTLYGRYTDWMSGNPDQQAGIVSVSRWGVAMSLRFRRGKNYAGRFYYVSQETAQEVLEKLGG